MNVECSRRHYLNLRAQQEFLQQNYLETTRRSAQWIKEKQKRQFKRCNSTFGCQKIKAMNRVEYREEGVLIQINTKEEVENTVMRENSSRFRLTYSALILEDRLCTELGLSGEGDLSKDIFRTSKISMNSQRCTKSLLFFISLHMKQFYYISRLNNR